MNQNKLLVKLENAGVQRTSKWLVKGISFEISQGQIVTLIGPNGSGKTTTAKMILNIMSADEGQITKNTHGTGCTLSSAITTLFSCGKSLKNACELGIKYVNSAILTNPKYGKGHGPINHINSISINRKFR